MKKTSNYFKTIQNERKVIMLYVLATTVTIWQLLLNRVSLDSLSNIALRMLPYVFCAVIILLIFKELLWVKWNGIDVLMFFICIFVCIDILCSKQYRFASLPLILFSGRNLDIKKIMKPILGGQLLFYLGIFLLFKIGILPNPISSDVQNAVAFGFKYHSYLPNLFLFDCIAYFAVYEEKIKVYKIVILFIINLILYNFSAKTMNAFILTSVFLLCCLFYKRLSAKVVTYAAILGTAVSPFVWIIFLKLYASGSSVGFSLNELVTNRIMLAVNGLRQYGIHLIFNSNVQMYAYESRNIIGAQYDYVDSGITKYAIYFGILFVFLLYMILVRSEVLYAKKNMSLVVVGIFIMSIHFIFDEELLWIDLNPAVLLLCLSMRGRAFSKINDEKHIKR